MIIKTIDITTEQNHIAWIDNAKLITILLVVLGHLFLKNYHITTFIYSFHMSLFFFLSGFVMKKRTIKDELKKDFRTLIIPYIFFYILTYIWWVFTTYPSHPELFQQNIVDKYMKPFIGLFIGYSSSSKVSIMLNAPLWFLLTLFWCRVIVTLNISDKKIFDIILAAVCVLGSVLQSCLKYILPFGLTPIFTSLLFFLAGKYFRLFYFEFSHFVLKIGIPIVLFLILYFLSSFNNRVDLSTNNLNNIILFYINAIIGIFAMLFLCQSIKTINKLNIISSNTLIIMSLQGIMISIINRLYNYIFKFDYNSLLLWQGVIVTLSVVIFLIPIIILFNRVLPFVLGKNTVKGNK